MQHARRPETLKARSCGVWAKDSGGNKERRGKGRQEEVKGKAMTGKMRLDAHQLCALASFSLGATVLPPDGGKSCRLAVLLPCSALLITMRYKNESRMALNSLRLIAVSLELLLNR